MSETDMRAAERQAVEYLAGHFGEQAPQHLRLEGEFDERPLEDEGRTFLFSFDLDAPTAACGEAERRHFVAAGETEPNYFPAYGLQADDAYSFHIGTRFMLEMRMQVVDPSYEPPFARAALREFVANYAKGAPIEHEELAALFRCGDDEGYFAVFRLTLGGRDVYCMGANCPPGFYDLVRHPPQTALRLHLGKIIRNEARHERENSGESTDA